MNLTIGPGIFVLPAIVAGNLYPAVINAMTDILAIWIPAFSVTYIRIIFFIFLFGSFAMINIRGVKQGAQFAASEDKLLPNFPSRAHQEFATPCWEIIIYAAAGLIFASLSDFKQLAELAASSVLFIYLAVVLATIRLWYKKDLAKTEGLKCPWVTHLILGIVATSWFLSHITLAEVKAPAVFFVILTVIYFINKAVRKKRYPLVFNILFHPYHK